MEILQKYMHWIYQKIKVNQKERSIQINEKEVYWCSLGENVGDEENGKGNDFRRPVLVFKKFNKNLCWAIPMTTKNKENKYYLSVNLNGEIRSLLLSQLRIMDTKRFDEKIGFISEADYTEIKNKVIEIINFDPRK